MADSPVYQMALRARQASRAMAGLSAATRNAALGAMARALMDNSDQILAANQRDYVREREGGMSESLLDRLLLTEERLAGIADALRQLMRESDPIGEVIEGRTLESGIRLTCVRVPLGVVAMIYEARPNVTADAAGLCVKTGNACILRGGSAAVETNRAMTGILAQAAEGAGLPHDCIQQIDDTSHQATAQLMELHELIDVLIPRGGRSLIQSCVQNSKVPVIETGTGNCHVYIHETGDIDMAQRIIINAKCQRPGVCNACESVLVDRTCADAVLPKVMVGLAEHGVRIHGDAPSRAVAQTLGLLESGAFVDATEEDWGTEYLSLDISIKVVGGLDEAIGHINRYGTKHSEAIITRDLDAAARFTGQVDAAAVYVNASTRFTDGGMFGLGAEIGISTQKLHARGPMGLVAMTTSKYILMGEGQTR